MNTIPLINVDSPTVILELIYRLKIKDVMTKEVITAGERDTMRSIKNLMKENGITGVPIVRRRRLVGIISVDDIIRALDDGKIDEPAELYMSRTLIVLEEDMPLSFGISYFDKYRYGRFPVLGRNQELAGIITSRDVIMGLLLEINKEVEKLESRMKSSEPMPGGGICEEYPVRKFDFKNAGRASTEIKKVIKTRGVDPKTARRVAVACYELEMNQVVHSDGGTIRFTVDGGSVTIIARDTGPGIPDVDQAMQEGYSTANEWIRSLGFGAGMGLPNVRRVSDEFEIESAVGSGTRVRSVIHIGTEEERNDAHQ